MKCYTWKDLMFSHMMTDNAIGASVGEQHVKDLEGFMNMKPQDNGIFLSVSYDMSKQMEIQAALAEQFQIEHG